MHATGCKQFTMSMGGQTRTVNLSAMTVAQTLEEDGADWSVPIRVRPAKASFDATVELESDDDEARAQERHAELERDMAVVTVMKS